MHNDKEKRKYKRVKKPFIVSFQIKTSDAPRKGPAVWDMVAVLNLGAGGMLFYYNKELKLDALMDLKINLLASKSPIECKGKVIRSEKLPFGHMYLVAVIFTDIDEKERAQINKAAEEYHAQKKSQK